MADIGELVKLSDGRWARFQHCPVYGQEGAGGLSLMVAVELDERTQRMLDVAESARGIEVEPAARPRLEQIDVGAAGEIAPAVQ
jgi:hypothetical protein